MGEGIKIIEIIVYVHKQTPETVPQNPAWYQQ